MTPIDFLASERHFIDHLAPIWLALPPAERGVFVVGGRQRPYDDERTLAAHAASLGIEPSDSLPLRDRPMVTAASGDLRRARGFGRSRVALLEHGSGQSFGGDPRTAHHPSYPGGLRRHASLFIAPNGHAAGRDAAAYPEASTAIVGCPKLDALPERSSLGSGKPVVAVSFHWDCTVAPETASGWRDFRAALAGLTSRYKILGHGHPRIIDELAREYRRLGIEVVRNFVDVVARAHVYVNEGSSTLFEAAAAGIPVVVLNPRGFRTNVEHGLRFWEAADVGPNVRARGTWDWKTADRLAAAIDLAIADPPERQAAREHALSIVYAHRTGAAQRAAAAVLEWAATPAAAPASEAVPA